jgi:hypothetical protein
MTAREIDSFSICQSLAKRRQNCRMLANRFAKVRQTREFFAGCWQFFGGIAVAAFLVWFGFVGYWRTIAFFYRLFGLMD